MNAVHVNYITEEEKQERLFRQLEMQRKAKRTINWESIGQKCLGFLLLLVGIAAYKLTKIDSEFGIIIILAIFFGLIAILGSGSIYKRNYEWEEV